MRHLLVLFFVLSISLVTFSQVVTQNEKLYSDAVKQREYLESLLSEGKFSEITREDLMVDDISIVQMNERIYLYALIGDFSTFIPEFFATFGYHNSKSSEEIIDLANSSIYYRSFIMLFGDEFSNKLFDLFNNKSDLIRKNVANSDLSEEEKTFVLGALFNQIAKYNYCNFEVKNEVESIKNNFDDKYPNSIYKDYINEKFYETYIPGSWGIGFFAEGGVVIPDGKLAQYITSGSNIEFGMALYYDRFILTGMFGGGGLATIKKTFHKEVDWNEGDDLGFMGGSLTLGYELLDKSIIHITPYAGIGGYGLSPSSSEESDYYDEVENVTPQNSMIVGLRFDFLYTKDYCSKKYLVGEKALNYEGIKRIVRLNVGFSSPQYNKSVPGLKGNMWFAKLGWGIFGRKSL